MKYNSKIVLAYFKEVGLPKPLVEYKFHPERKWQFDFAWKDLYVALEVQGGIFIKGRHNQGAAMLKEWEKLNVAACLGWKILYCQPEDLCLLSTAFMIKRALQLGP